MKLEPELTAVWLLGFVDARATGKARLRDFEVAFSEGDLVSVGGGATTLGDFLTAAGYAPGAPVPREARTRAERALWLDHLAALVSTRATGTFEPGGVAGARLPAYDLIMQALTNLASRGLAEELGKNAAKMLKIHTRRAELWIKATSDRVRVSHLLMSMPGSAARITAAILVGEAELEGVGEAKPAVQISRQSIVPMRPIETAEPGEPVQDSPFATVAEPKLALRDPAEDEARALASEESGDVGATLTHWQAAAESWAALHAYVEVYRVLREAAALDESASVQLAAAQAAENALDVEGAIAYAERALLAKDAAVATPASLIAARQSLRMSEDASVSRYLTTPVVREMSTDELVRFWECLKPSRRAKRLADLSIAEPAFVQAVAEGDSVDALRAASFSQVGKHVCAWAVAYGAARATSRANDRDTLLGEALVAARTVGRPDLVYLTRLARLADLTSSDWNELYEAAPKQVDRALIAARCARLSTDNSERAHWLRAAADGHVSLAATRFLAVELWQRSLELEASDEALERIEEYAREIGDSGVYLDAVERALDSIDRRAVDIPALRREYTKIAVDLELPHRAFRMWQSVLETEPKNVDAAREIARLQEVASVRQSLSELAERDFRQNRTAQGARKLAALLRDDPSKARVVIDLYRYALSEDPQDARSMLLALEQSLRGRATVAERVDIVRRRLALDGLSAAERNRAYVGLVTTLMLDVGDADAMQVAGEWLSESNHELALEHLEFLVASAGGASSFAEMVDELRCVRSEGFAFPRAAARLIARLSDAEVAADLAERSLAVDPNAADVALSLVAAGFVPRTERTYVLGKRLLDLLGPEPRLLRALRDGARTYDTANVWQWQLALCQTLRSREELRNLADLCSRGCSVEQAEAGVLLFANSLSPEFTRAVEQCVSVIRERSSAAAYTTLLHHALSALPTIDISKDVDALVGFAFGYVAGTGTAVLPQVLELLIARDASRQTDLLRALASVHRIESRELAELRTLVRLFALEPQSVEVARRLHVLFRARGDESRAAALGGILPADQLSVPPPTSHGEAEAIARLWPSDASDALRSRTLDRRSVAAQPDVSIESSRAATLALLDVEVAWILAEDNTRVAADYLDHHARGISLDAAGEEGLRARAAQAELFLYATRFLMESDVDLARARAAQYLKDGVRHPDLLELFESLAREAVDSSLAASVFSTLLERRLGLQSERALRIRFGKWLESIGSDDEALTEYVMAFRLLPRGGEVYRAIERLARRCCRFDELASTLATLVRQERDVEMRILYEQMLIDVLEFEVRSPERARDALLEFFETSGRLGLLDELRRFCPVGSSEREQLRAQLRARVADSWSPIDAARTSIELAKIALDENAEAEVLQLARDHFLAAVTEDSGVLAELVSFVDTARKCVGDAGKTELAALRGELEAAARNSAEIANAERSGALFQGAGLAGPVAPNVSNESLPQSGGTSGGVETPTAGTHGDFDDEDFSDPTRRGQHPSPAIALGHPPAPRGLSQLSRLSEVPRPTSQAIVRPSVPSPSRGSVAPTREPSGQWFAAGDVAAAALRKESSAGSVVAVLALASSLSATQPPAALAALLDFVRRSPFEPSALERLRDVARDQGALGVQDAALDLLGLLGRPVERPRETWAAWTDELDAAIGLLTPMQRALRILWHANPAAFRTEPPEHLIAAGRVERTSLLPAAQRASVAPGASQAETARDVALCRRIAAIDAAFYITPDHAGVFATELPTVTAPAAWVEQSEGRRYLLAAHLWNASSGAILIRSRLPEDALLILRALLAAFGAGEVLKETEPFVPVLLALPVHAQKEIASLLAGETRDAVDVLFELDGVIRVQAARLGLLVDGSLMRSARAYARLHGPLPTSVEAWRSLHQASDELKAMVRLALSDEALAARGRWMRDRTSS